MILKTPSSVMKSLVTRVLSQPTGLLTLGIRVSLGCWFTYSGVTKILGGGLERFTRDIGNYQLVAPPLDAIAAYTVPWFEVVAGICLVLGFLRRGAILMVAGLVGVFAGCIGWAWVHHLDISCGCHGGDAPIAYWNKVAEFAGYAVLLVWLWTHDRRATAIACR
jgi:uncharacterized membrane protein YphA (DoxX/SURF4 family)